MGVAIVAICANDAISHPEDSFDKMKDFARQYGFTFPYLHDATQTVARAYDAVCTPDFLGFNGKLELQYRGRLDESKTMLVPNARRDLFEAMSLLPKREQAPRASHPWGAPSSGRQLRRTSVGCGSPFPSRYPLPIPR